MKRGAYLAIPLLYQLLEFFKKKLQREISLMNDGL